MNQPAAHNSTPGLFPATRWSVVLAATQGGAAESAEAMEVLCRVYWYPLYAYVRRHGHSPHDAQDLTQEFFAQLLERRWLASVDREKGRLRSFLMVALKHFLLKEWRRASSQKRGGGRTPVALDTAGAESLYAVDASAGLDPDQAYDRQWALTLLEITFKRLHGEFAKAGRADEFEILKGTLMAAHGNIDYAGIAARLKLQPGTARVAAHRLRKRFREIYREEISQTLAAEADVEEELRHLAALNGLGQFYLSQGKYDQAEAFLVKAAPQASAAWFGLARLYLLEGNFAQAERWAQNIVDSGQADEVAQKMLQAAKDKKLSEGLRLMITPHVAKSPAKEL